jgi:hypothetical protein
MKMTRAAVAALLAVGAGSFPATSVPTLAAGSELAVIELFTSQGCSSCPPADALLAKYAARDDVLALSLPVDYWDRLGWKDTFASPAYSARQRDYATVRRDGEVYTPQAVINGLAHAVGSSAAAIDSKIALTRSRQANSRVPITLTIEGGALVVHAGQAIESTEGARGQLLVALVQDSGTVSIKRGENTGRRVTYRNIVRRLTPIASWSGSPVHVRLPLSDLKAPSVGTVAVLLQGGKGGQILGAAKIPLSGPKM